MLALILCAFLLGTVVSSQLPRGQGPSRTHWGRSGQTASPGRAAPRGLGDTVQGQDWE